MSDDAPPPAKRMGNPAWTKGVSANPSGMGKVAVELQRAARIVTAEALETTIAIMRDPTVKPETRLRAVEMIWERGHGKPKQGIELTGEDGEPIKQAIRIAVSFHDPGEAVEGPVIDGAIDDGSIPEGV